MSQFYTALRTNATQFSDKVTIVDAEASTRWTFQQFLEQVDWAATAFQQRGVTPGEHVGLMLYNQKEFLVCFFALRKLGAVIVPINIQMLPQDIGFVIQNAHLRRMVIADTLYPHLKGMPLDFIVVGEAIEGVQHYDHFIESANGITPADPAPTQDTDLAFLLYTSGTTGYPKGVMLSEHNVLANMGGFQEGLHFTENDRFVLALPLFHAYGLICALAGVFIGAEMVLVPKFSIKRILEVTEQAEATILPLVPTLYSVLLELIAKQGGVSLPQLRFCVSGGASLPEPLLRKIEAVLQSTVIEGYGLTEASPVLTVNDPVVGSIPNCVGKPLSNVQIRIVDKDGALCAASEVGEIHAKGDNIMTGYYQLPAETAEALTEDGWLKTGDLGHLDGEGRLFISGGRIKDLIIKAGENISPLSIEAVLYQLPGIREAAVIGIPHDKLGEDIVACVSLSEDAALSPSDILRHCRANLTPLYIPASVEILDDLPKNPTGKIVKKLLKGQLQQRATVN